MEPCAKIQKWIESIMADELESVARELEGPEYRHLDPRLNKLVFRALLCLSHAAGRTPPSKVKTGKDICRITDGLCYSLTAVPDLMKFYSSLYHIARKLIEMRLLPEATRVTAWSFPSNLVCALTSQHLDMYPRIANLWHEAALKLINASPGGLSKTDHTLLLEFLRNELRVLNVIVEQRTALVLSRVLRYLTKLDAVPIDSKFTGIWGHREIGKDFIAKIKVSLTGAEKYDVYNDALRFVNLTVNTQANLLHGENLLAVFTESCKVVEPIFSQDSELRSSLLTYKNMGIMVLKAFDTSSKKISHWDVDRISKETWNVVRNFTDGKGAAYNMRMIGIILQALFDQWERRVSSGDHGFLSQAAIQEILGLLKLMFRVLNSISTKGCEVCCDNGCTMSKNTHSVTVVSVRCLAILSKLSPADLVKNLFSLVQQVLEENVTAIFEMKEASCPQWPALWNNCGINIYNLSVTCHKLFYDETVFLFSLLCSCIVRFEGINNVNSIINIKDPMSYMLHRLSSVHFNHKNYREAITPCALNGLLSYRNSESKAFRMWANIKQACASSKNISKITMLSCLRQDMDVISEIGVDVRLADYDLKELCLQELRGLHNVRCDVSVAMESALDELEALDCQGLKYAQGIQLLGYHMLHYQWDESFTRRQIQAVRILKKVKVPNSLCLLTSASLDFYSFVRNLHEIVDRTKAEMETTKIVLRAPKSVPNEGQPSKTDGVVPAYTKINVTQDMKLFNDLKQALHKWSLCLENNLISVAEDWHLTLTLRTIVIVAEYTRLHRFSTLEIKAWKLAYKLASQLSDSRTCVYVVSRSMSLRSFSREWVSNADELTTELKASSASEDQNIVALFWIGLSNLNFDIAKHKEAVEILERVLSLPNMSPVQNSATYLLSLETYLRNYHLCSNDNQSTKYMVYLGHSLYSMLGLMDYLPQSRVGVKEKQLYFYEVLFTCTSHLSLRMNSLLSFKEISSHLINRLKLSQGSGIALRVAECLKNLCFIDLSQMHLDNCMVKLHGLEYILQTEYIGESQNAVNPKILGDKFGEPGARDPCHNDTSPVFRKTVFKQPDFLSHYECDCYKCSSIHYQNLVLAGTHIRAQLYFLQGHLNEAMKHFDGAFLLSRKIIRNNHALTEQNGEKYCPWICQYDAVEYALLLINFSRFIRELDADDSRDGLNVAVEAVGICERFCLHGHPIYVAAKELVLEYQFCNTYNDDDFSKFTVPDPSSIDINKFTGVINAIDSSAVTTPGTKPCAKKPKTIRRNKTPPLLKLTKVSLNLSDEEDEKGSESPKSSRYRTKMPRGYRRPIKIKQLKKYFDSSSDDASTTEDESDTAGSWHVEAPAEMVTVKTEDINLKSRFLSQVMMTSVALPHLSKQLNEIYNEKGIDDLEKFQRVIKLIEQQKRSDKPNSKTKNSRKKSSGAKSRLANSGQNHVVDELIDSFKQILIGSNNANNINLNDSTVSQYAEERLSAISTHSISNFNSSFSANNEKTTFNENKEDSDIAVDDKRSILPANAKMVTRLPKPENLHQKERLRASQRGKKGKSQSSSETEQRDSGDLIIPNIKRCQSNERKEKPESSAKTRVNNVQDESDGVLSSVKEETAKKMPPNMQRVGKLPSEMVPAASSTLGRMEESWSNNSDLVLTSDVEEKANFEERRNGVVHKYGTRTSSRITRSRSQMNGAAASKLKTVENSDSVSASDTEESAEGTKIKNRAQKTKSKGLTRAKKCSKSLFTDTQQPATSSDPANDQEDQKITQLTVLKESESQAKCLAGKRSTSSRFKLKR